MALLLIVVGLMFMLAATGLAFYLKPYLRVLGQEIGFSSDRPSEPGITVLSAVLTTGLFLVGSAVVIVGIVQAAVGDDGASMQRQPIPTIGVHGDAFPASGHPNAVFPARVD